MTSDISSSYGFVFTEYIDTDYNKQRSAFEMFDGHKGTGESRRMNVWIAV